MYLDSSYGALAPSVTPNRRSARHELADIIDRALAALDALDGDPDLEPDDDGEDGGDLEPSLGASEVNAQFWSQIGWARGGDGDLECDRI